MSASHLEGLTPAEQAQILASGLDRSDLMRRSVGDMITAYQTGANVADIESQTATRLEELPYVSETAKARIAQLQSDAEHRRAQTEEAKRTVEVTLSNGTKVNARVSDALALEAVRARISADDNRMIEWKLPDGRTIKLPPESVVQLIEREIVENSKVTVTTPSGTYKVTPSEKLAHERALEELPYVSDMAKARIAQLQSDTEYRRAQIEEAKRTVEVTLSDGTKANARVSDALALESIRARIQADDNRMIEWKLLDGRTVKLPPESVAQLIEREIVESSKVPVTTPSGTYKVTPGEKLAHERALADDIRAREERNAANQRQLQLDQYNRENKEFQQTIMASEERRRREAAEQKRHEDAKEYEGGVFAGQYKGYQTTDKDKPIMADNFNKISSDPYVIIETPGDWYGRKYRRVRLPTIVDKGTGEREQLTAEKLYAMKMSEPNVTLRGMTFPEYIQHLFKELNLDITEWYLN